jgi:hypothetical protein
MSKLPKISRSYKPLINAPTGNPGEKYYAVCVSHQELDNLVGRLMQMCDLTGDIEQRKALKGTIKQISRDWLDNLYEESGYNTFTGKLPEVDAIEI